MIVTMYPINLPSNQLIQMGESIRFHQDRLDLLWIIVLSVSQPMPMDLSLKAVGVMPMDVTSLEAVVTPMDATVKAEDAQPMAA